MLTGVEKLIDKKQGTRHKKKGTMKKVQEARHKKYTTPTCALYLESCALFFSQNFDSMQLPISAACQIVLV